MNPYHLKEYFDLFSSVFPASSLVKVNKFTGIAWDAKLISLPGFTLPVDCLPDLNGILEESLYTRCFFLLRSLVDPSEFAPSHHAEYSLRSNFYFDLISSQSRLETIYARARKDSKRAFNKIFGGDSPYYAITTSSPSEIDNFVSCYMANHKEKQMSPMYVLNSDGVARLVHHDSWRLISVKRSEDTVGWVLGCLVGSEFDQAYLAYNPSIKDASRLVIYSTLKSVMDLQFVSAYKMGGGIVEGDSLDQYKQSLGAMKSCCSVIKSISKRDPGYSDGIVIGSCRWP